ncbi:MAG TPA: feruloyl-CoA synthase [Roseiarcus sp.]|jgi:feruloyl-CoA synthase
MTTRTKLTLGPPEVIVERRADGVMLARSPHPLSPHARAATDWLDHWAAVAPERVFLAERDGSGFWRKVTYGEARAGARAVAQGLIDRELSVERPVAILSGNSVDHALLGLGAMVAGVPYAPVSAPYSLVARDFAKLKAIIAVLTPGLVFVDDGGPFLPALQAAVPDEVEIVTRANAPASRRSSAFEALLSTRATEVVDRAQAKVGPDTIAKLLFTSGSTGAPKGVVNTHRMMTSNQAMLSAVTPSYAAEPPVLIDWLPWSHTFGGNNNFNLVLANGGSFFIDEGRPLPGAIEATARNLREISPTVYYNVPRGFEMLLPLLEADPELRRSLFKRLQAFTYAGAALAPHVREAFERLGVETIGEIVPMLTSFGSTETGPSAISVTERARDPGVIGVPNPGVELKLVPNAGKLEARVKSPSVTPGYWRQPELSEAAFDEEGFYKFGDALRFVDENDPERGFLFDGRVAEDFKLATGAWVSVGPLRARFVAHCAPYVTDVVVAGHDRDEAAALVIPNLAACRELAGSRNGAAAPAEILDCDDVRERFASLLKTFNAGAGGSSRRLARLILMDDPPSLDTGELTDKGSVNQRAVLSRRAAIIEELYADSPSRRVIL